MGNGCSHYEGVCKNKLESFWNIFIVFQNSNLKKRKKWRIVWFTKIIKKRKICALLSEVSKFQYKRIFYLIRKTKKIIKRLRLLMSSNGLRDRGSIPGRVIPKTQEIVLDISLFNTQYYKVRIKRKWSNPRKGVAFFPPPRFSSYWKGSLRVALDYGRQRYQFYLLIWFLYKL